MDLCWFRYITFIFVRDYGLPYQLIPSPAGCLTSAWPVASSASRVVVSNADNGLFGAAEEVTDAQIDHQTATNLIGSIQFTRAGIPHLRQQGGGELFKSRPKAARSRTRPSACITQPNGASKASSNLPLRKSRPWELTSLSSNPVPTATNFGAWCAPRRRTSIRIRPPEEYARWKNTPAGRIRPLVRCTGLLPWEALSSRAMLGAKSMP
jgi:hypothetical protein